MRLLLKLEDVESSLAKGARVSFYIFSHAGCIKFLFIRNKKQQIHKDALQEIFK